MITRIKKNSGLFIKISFFIALFIILIAGSTAYKTTKNLSDSSNLVMKTYLTNVQLEQILSYLKDAETGQRGFIITNDSTFLQSYLESRDQINNSFAELKELTNDDEIQQNSLKSLNLLIDKRLNNFEKTTWFSQTNKNKAPKFDAVFNEGKELMDAIRAQIAEMIVHENADLTEKQEDYKSNATLTPIFVFVLILLSLGLVLIAYRRISNDVLNLKKYNEELEVFKESANQSEIISGNGNWVFNVDENTYQYSDNLFRLLGEEPNSFVPTEENFMKFVHPDDAERLKTDVDKMLVDEHLPFVYYRVIKKNGDIRHFKAYGQNLEIDGVSKVIGTTSDVTDEIENYKLLEERNSELESNNKELSAFNHVASHDLQEPLRKIQTFLSRLNNSESENLSENGVKYVSRAQNAAQRMRSLIDDLLQFSRTNKAEAAFTTANVNTLFETAKQDLGEVILESDAVIHADTFPEMEVIPFQIQQLFLNLLSNSIKYRKTDTPPIINITYQQINTEEAFKLINPKYTNYHKLTFTDNGIGFDNQYSENIFVLFNRLHGKNEYSGTGIGLSICKKIIENHKGYIFAHGALGEGATFEIFLPVK